MSQVSAIILLDGTRVGYVCNRSPMLDDDLRAAGIDPETINVVDTPLIGASRHAEICVLALMFPQSFPDPRPFDFDAAYGMVVDSATSKYALHVFEPRAGVGSGGSGSSESGKGTATDISDASDVIVSPPLDDQEVVDTPPTPQRANNSGGAAVATSSTLQTAPSGRQMIWNSLTLVDAHEVLTSVARGFGYISLDPALPNGGGSLFILRFVDARARLRGQTIWSQPGVFQDSGIGQDQWNMLADNPLHLVAQTAKASQRLSPNDEGPAYPLPGTVSAGVMRGVPSPSPWYNDVPHSASDIIGAYTSMAWAWDREDVTFVYQTVASQMERPGDMLNLDLRGRSIGQSLDEIAARIGCVWVWNRYTSQLILRPFDYGVPGGPAAPYNVPLWIYYNGPFRCGGGLGEVTNALPGAWAVVNPIRYASVYGTSNEADVFVDWRAMATPDGVRHFDLQTSERPPLHFSVPFGKGRTQFLGDHVPALYGKQGRVADRPVGQPPSPTEYSVWNAVAPQSSVACRWWSKSWAISLQDRHEALRSRYVNAKLLIDGDVVMHRMPAYGMTSPMMNESPTAGLQFDRLRFGMGERPLEYRLFGSNTDTIVFPHLLPADRVRSLGLGSAYSATGCLHLQRLDRRSGIVRTFLAEFAQVDVLKQDAVTGEPYAWLYRIREVQPSNLSNGSFVLANDWGNEILAVEGRALNLCELGTITTDISETPTVNFDGGTLRYDPESGESTILRASPSGVAPCYEFVAQDGMTYYFLYAPPGVLVTCPGSTAALKTSAWQKSGASGTAFVDRVSLAGIVADMPVAEYVAPVASNPPETP